DEQMFGVDEQVLGRGQSDEEAEPAVQPTQHNRGKRVMKRFVFAALTISLLSSPAAASWRLIPGKPYDGHYPISVLKEPCWSAAVSKCALERNRKQYIDDARKAPQR